MTKNLLFVEGFKLFKRSRAWVGPVLVFLLIIISFPLTLDIDSDNPPQIYLSFIWISTLLVTMLGTELIFSEDFEDGTLEQYAVKNKLIEINTKLWDIEDNKRMCEKNSDFGENFIKLSREVHFLNDDRAKIKLAINNQTGSKIKEIKQYTNY